MISIRKTKETRKNPKKPEKTRKNPKKPEKTQKKPNKKEEEENHLFFFHSRKTHKNNPT
jgi:hypothetical protein